MIEPLGPINRSRDWFEHVILVTFSLWNLIEALVATGDVDGAARWRGLVLESR